jgi:AraC family transcriptional regulator, regulatory protein of adaptative response / methylated-DNA-[protein]-cysteine methyltransferase
MVDRPTVARAVGNAIGKNPIGYLIPCHRVIRESGELGGFGWGVERKTVMLGWEASHAICGTTFVEIERSNHFPRSNGIQKVQNTY